MKLEESSSSCVICCDPIQYFSLGICQHRGVCHLCSLRLRALYKSIECSLCKTILDEVIFTQDAHRAFTDYYIASLLNIDKNLNIYCESKLLWNEIHELLANQCSYAGCHAQLKDTTELKNHVEKQHQLYLCDICLSYKKVFCKEQKLFNKKDLQRHYSVGDLDDLSFRGHPQCLFCKQHFYGKDELYEHCRSHHETCHICERNGKRHVYYRDYDNLEDHFREEHYTCENKDCLERKFVVFPSAIDLKAHEASMHSQGLSKQQQKQARHINLGFSQNRDRPNKAKNRDGRTAGMMDLNNLENDQHRRVKNIDLTTCPRRTQSTNDLLFMANQTKSRAAEFTSKREAVSFEKSSAAHENVASSSSTSEKSGTTNQPDVLIPPGFEVKENKSMKIKAPPGFGTHLTNPPAHDFPSLQPTTSRSTIASVFDKSSLTANLSKDFARASQISKSFGSRPNIPNVSNNICLDPNLEKRNQELIKNIKKALYFNEQKFHEFRNMSLAFRQNKLPAEDYYHAFISLFKDRDTVNRLFSELIDLLPDEKKRQELLTIHNDRKAQKSNETIHLQLPLPQLIQHPMKDTSSGKLPIRPFPPPIKSGHKVLVIKTASKDAKSLKNRSLPGITLNWEKERLNRIQYHICKDCGQTVQSQDMELHAASHYVINKLQ